MTRTTTGAFRSSQVEVDDVRIHVVDNEIADGRVPTVVFLHGWPQNWSAFEHVMARAQDTAHVIALDLPGIGESQKAPRSNDKRTLAGYVHSLLTTLGIQDVTLVGHDIGGQIAYSYLQAHPDELARAVIMDAVIPGIAPWQAVLHNPYLWHFAFHTIPTLPEELVFGKQAAYFDFFFNAITAHPDAISPRARQNYAEAYARRAALKTGFDWYRAFAQDARENTEKGVVRVETPALYLRGEREGGDMQEYVQGLRESGLQHVTSSIIPDSGHYTPEEQPEAVWSTIAKFMGL